MLQSLAAGLTAPILCSALLAAVAYLVLLSLSECSMLPRFGLLLHEVNMPLLDTWMPLLHDVPPQAAIVLLEVHRFPLSTGIALFVLRDGSLPAAAATLS